MTTPLEEALDAYERAVTAIANETGTHANADLCRAEVLRIVGEVAKELRPVASEGCRDIEAGATNDPCTDRFPDGPYVWCAPCRASRALALLPREGEGNPPRKLDGSDRDPE